MADIVTAGFPCPAFSQARGKANPDPWANPKNLWPDTIRAINEIKPTWLLLENVPGLLSASHGYFGKILRDLAKSGFDVEWDVLSAADEGADHIRDRLWICGHAHGKGESVIAEYGETPRLSPATANAGGRKLQKHNGAKRGEEAVQGSWNPWSVEPGFPRVADGVADFMDRSRAIGNGQVPAVAVRAWRELSERFQQ